MQWPRSFTEPSWRRISAASLLRLRQKLKEQNRRTGWTLQLAHGWRIFLASSPAAMFIIQIAWESELNIEGFLESAITWMNSAFIEERARFCDQRACDAVNRVRLLRGPVRSASRPLCERLVRLIWRTSRYANGSKCRKFSSLEGMP